MVNSTSRSEEAVVLQAMASTCRVLLSRKVGKISKLANPMLALDAALCPLLLSSLW